MERRSAQCGCPMCGCDDETRGEVYIDADYMCIDYTCNRCGIRYSVNYTLQYTGFDLGQASWDANGDPIKDEEMYNKE